MRFRRDTPVLTLDGQEAGTIDRVVLEPVTREVTHIVLRKGFLAEGKLVPVDLIGVATDEHVSIRAMKDDLHALPPFEQARFVEATEPGDGDRQGSLESPVAGLFPYLGPLPPMGPMGSPEPALPQTSERNIPEGTVPLKTGARVIASDGKKVGLVEEVLTDPHQDRATDLVVAGGSLLHKTKWRVPMDWVTEVREGEVHLAVGVRSLQEV
jgi:sporulation protein YlmC with PRC-barrel domain